MLRVEYHLITFTSPSLTAIFFFLQVACPDASFWPTFDMRCPTLFHCIEVSNLAESFSATRNVGNSHSQNYGCPSNRHGISEILDVSKLSENCQRNHGTWLWPFVKSSIRKTVSFQHSTCMMFAILPVSLHMIPILIQQKKWGMKASPLTDMIPATPLPSLWRIWSKAGGTKETVTCLVRQAFQDTLATSTELK